MNSFTTVIYTFKVSKHIIIGQSTNINIFSWLLSFFKLRERESGMQSLGIKENGPKVTYLIFRRGSTGESFFFHGLLDFVLFLILAWRTQVPHVSVFFCLQPGVEWLWFVCPLRTLLKNCLSSYLLPLRGRGPHFRFEVPANHLASLFSSLVSGDLSVTKYQHLVSPVWPTFLPNGHLFDG